MAYQVLETRKNLALVKEVRPRKFPYANSVATSYHVVEVNSNGWLNFESGLNCYNFSKLDTIKQLFNLLTGESNNE